MELTSWMFADKGNNEPLQIFSPGFLLTPDNKFLKTDGYDGRGSFSDKDVFELIVDWNREHLVALLLAKGAPYIATEYDIQLAEKAMISDDEAERFVERTNVSDIIIWKRNLGILLACSNEDNARLAYPIKVVSRVDRNFAYADIPASMLDPKHGF